jgi:hypothetical protein
MESDYTAGCAREASQELERRSGRKGQGLLTSLRMPAKVEQRVLTTTATGSNLIGEDYRPNLFVDVLRGHVRFPSGYVPHSALLETGKTSSDTFKR